MYSLASKMLESSARCVKAKASDKLSPGCPFHRAVLQAVSTSVEAGLSGRTSDVEIAKEVGGVLVCLCLVFFLKAIGWAVLFTLCY